MLNAWHAVGYRYIARDLDGDLSVFVEEPYMTDLGFWAERACWQDSVKIYNYNFLPIRKGEFEEIFYRKIRVK